MDSEITCQWLIKVTEWTNLSNVNFVTFRHMPKSTSKLTFSTVTKRININLSVTCVTKSFHFHMFCENIRKWNMMESNVLCVTNVEKDFWGKQCLKNMWWKILVTARHKRQLLNLWHVLSVMKPLVGGGILCSIIELFMEDYRQIAKVSF